MVGIKSAQMMHNCVGEGRLRPWLHTKPYHRMGRLQRGSPPHRPAIMYCIEYCCHVPPP